VLTGCQRDELIGSVFKGYFTDPALAEDGIRLVLHEGKVENLELENANTAKDRFLASMSHELRTPLNAVLGFTGTLLMGLPGPLNDEQRRQLGTFQSSGKHLLSIINDLLDLDKIE
jgi:signal transduction histidine kinase